MKFLELLHSNTEIAGEILTGVEDMPASFVWSPGDRMLPDGIEKFKPLMECEAQLTRCGDVYLKDCDNELAKQFVMAAAGYISSEDYDRYFGEEDEETEIPLF